MWLIRFELILNVCPYLTVVDVVVIVDELNVSSQLLIRIRRRHKGIQGIPEIAGSFKKVSGSSNGVSEYFRDVSVVSWGFHEASGALC